MSAQMLKSGPLPIASRWKKEEQVAGLRVLLSGILDGLNHNMTFSQFVAWALLESRYKYVGVVNDSAGKGVLHDDHSVKFANARLC